MLTTEFRYKCRLCGEEFTFGETCAEDTWKWVQNSIHGITGIQRTSMLCMHSCGGDGNSHQRYGVADFIGAVVGRTGE